MVLKALLKFQCLQMPPLQGSAMHVLVMHERRGLKYFILFCFIFSMCKFPLGVWKCKEPTPWFINELIPSNQKCFRECQFLAWEPMLKCYYHSLSPIFRVHYSIWDVSKLVSTFLNWYTNFYVLSKSIPL